MRKPNGYFSFRFSFYKMLCLSVSSSWLQKITKLFTHGYMEGGGRNRIGKKEKWPKKSWEEGEIGGKSREEGENVR